MLYQLACTDGEPEACYHLGRFHAAQGDSSASQQALERACSGGHGGACMQLAEQYHHGRGVARDAFRADALYRDACIHGHMDACDKAGGLHY